MNNNRTWRPAALAGVASLILLFPFRKLYAQTWTNGQSASYVIGQPDLTSHGAATSATSLSSPTACFVDPVSGKVFIADFSDHRVLRYPSSAAMSMGAPAEAVLGQSNLTTATFGLSSTKMANPFGLCMDGSGHLWVAEYGNRRVLRFDNAATLPTGSAASGVLGQPDFVTSNMGTSAGIILDPLSVFCSGTTLWVADYSGNRVLRYDNAALKTNGANADAVLGQPSFTTNTNATSSTGMYGPSQVYVDASGGLWVADEGNHRVLLFKNASTKANGSAADLVLGQANFSSGSPGVSATRLNIPAGVYGDAGGSIYVSDDGNNRILVFKNAATLTNGSPADYVLGQSDFSGSTSGSSAATLYGPYNIFINDKLMIADLSNNRVLVYIPAVPLPILLTGFTASLQNNGQQALIQWQATNNVNAGSFELQYGTDGSAFDIVLSRQAINPATTDYSYLQTSPARGNNYYRLKLINEDGNSSYSKVIGLTTDNPSGSSSLITLYPNPASDHIVLNLPVAQPAVVQLYNSAGSLLRTINTASIVNTMDISHLAPGLFTVRILQNGKKTALSFVKIKSD